MPKIFVTSEDPSLDYSPALQFGDKLVGVFPPGQVLLHPQVALFRARGILSKMLPEDYLALVGDPIKIGICMVVAAEIVGKVRVLKWNRQSYSYLPVEIDFNDHMPPTLDKPEPVSETGPIGP